jgi:short-subunit dehydrogenase
MINGSNIVIIGSSRGLGRETAKILCRQGHSLFCFSRDESSLETLKTECGRIFPGNPISVHAIDVMEVAGGSVNLLPLVQERFQKIDALLYNAGLLINKEFTGFKPAWINDIFQVNVIAAAAVIQQLLPLMGGKSPSHIVNTGSMGGVQGSVKFPGLSIYSASKAALATLSECLAMELSHLNIRVNCLALGSAQTEMLEEAFPGYQAPLSATDMAEYISHFVVHGHKHFNGKILPVAVSTP